MLNTKVFQQGTSLCNISAMENTLSEENICFHKCQKTVSSAIENNDHTLKNYISFRLIPKELKLHYRLFSLGILFYSILYIFEGSTLSADDKMSL